MHLPVGLISPTHFVGKNIFPTLRKQVKGGFQYILLSGDTGYVFQCLPPLTVAFFSYIATSVICGLSELAAFWTLQVETGVAYRDFKQRSQGVSQVSQANLDSKSWPAQQSWPPVQSMAAMIWTALPTSKSLWLAGQEVYFWSQYNTGMGAEQPGPVAPSFEVPVSQFLAKCHFFTLACRYRGRMGLSFCN